MNRRPRSAALALGLSLTALFSNTWGTTFTYTGGTGNWSTGSNWSGGTAPTSGSANLDISFNNSTFVIATQNIANPFILQSISLDGDGSLQIPSGSTIRFTNLGSAPQIRNSAASGGSPSLTFANSLQFFSDVTVNATRGPVLLSGVISGSGMLIKTGTNYSYLEGSVSNTYGNDTIVNGGTLYLAKVSGAIAIPGNIVINSGNVYVGGNSQVASTSHMAISGGTYSLNGFSQSLASLTMTSGYADLGNNGSLAIPSLSMQSGTSIYGGTNSTLTMNGNVAMTGTGSASVGAAYFNLGGTTRTVDIATGGTMVISGALSNGGITKTGAGSLSLSNTANSYTGTNVITAGTLIGSTIASQGVDSSFGRGDFSVGGSTLATLQYTGSTATTNRSVTLTGTAAAIDVNNSAATLTFTGSILGTAAFTKSGTGKLVFSGSNDYSGANTIAGGTLSGNIISNVGSNSSFGRGSFTLANLATLEYTGLTASTNRDLTLSSGTGTISVATSGETLTLTGNVTGTGGLTKTGAGTLQLSSNDTWGGATNINQGVVRSGLAGVVPDASNVTVASGASWDLNNLSETIGSLAGGGAVSLGTASLTTGNSTSSTYSGILSGGGNVLKVGTGSMTLSGANTYTGGTFVNAGTVFLSGNERLADTGAVEVNGGTLNVGGTETIGDFRQIAGSTSGGGALFTNGFDVRSGSISTSLRGTGALTKTTAGTVTLTGSNTYTGGTTVSAGILAANASSIPGDAVNDALIRFVGAGSYTGAISGSGAVEISANAVTFSGANTYSGGTTINSGAVLFASANSLPGNVLNNGGLTFNQATNGTFAGDITGTGSLSKIGAGEVILTGANAFAGGTSLNGGSLALGSNTAIGSGALNFALGSNAQLRADGAARTLANNYTFGGAGNFTFSGSENLSLAHSAPRTISSGQQLTSSNTATTTIAAPTTLQLGATLRAAAGNFVVGDLSSFQGFISQGTLIADPGATLTLRSAGFVDLASLTSLTGGTISAPNGVSVGASENVVGFGGLTGKIAAQHGSVIAATGGNLTLGSTTSVAGFFSDGELQTGTNTVTINDANDAVLGSLTTLGDGVSDGALVAGTAFPGDTRTHFLIEQGKNLVGRGHVVGNVKNHGSVIGDGPSLVPNERIVFDTGWKVSGIGDFANVLFNGTFAPGLSPGVVAGSDLAIGGTLEIELGGATPGNGIGHHDQVNDASVFTIAAGAALALQPYGGFLPTLGQEFTIVTAAAGFAGEFANVTVDPWFWQHGIDFQLSTTSSALVITAVAPHLSGDFNLDGSVDASDYTVWRHGLGTTYSQADLADWRANFGKSFSAGSAFDHAAVPEPSVMAAALLAIAGFASQRRRIEYRGISHSARSIAALLGLWLVSGPATRADIYVGPTETLQTSVDSGRIVNQGLAVGTIDEPLVFGPATRVQGGGEFVGTLSLGVFAPGNSPGVTTGTNQAFGASSIIEIELGGTLPGFSANNHDQIRDAATLVLLGGKLSILPYNNFIPTVGNEFVVLTWQQGLFGAFGTTHIDPFFTSHGITFTPIITNPTGSGNLTLKAVATAVPEVSAFVGIGTVAVFSAGISVVLKLKRSLRINRRG